MEHSIEEQPVLKKNSSTKTRLIFGGLVLLVLHLVYNWYQPVLGNLTGAIVFWMLVTIIIIVILLIFWNSGIEARAKEKNHLDILHRKEVRQKQVSETKDKKVLYTIGCVEKGEPVRWRDIIYIARYYTLPDGTIDITNPVFLKILPFIHLAELEKMIIRVDEDGMHWNGGELHVALQLIEQIAVYQRGVSKEIGVTRLVEQLRNFLNYCQAQNDKLGCRKILKEVRRHAPMLRKLVNSRKFA